MYKFFHYLGNGSSLLKKSGLFSSVCDMYSGEGLLMLQHRFDMIGKFYNRLPRFSTVIGWQRLFTSSNIQRFDVERGNFPPFFFHRCVINEAFSTAHFRDGLSYHVIKLDGLSD